MQDIVAISLYLIYGYMAINSGTSVVYIRQMINNSIIQQHDCYCACKIHSPLICPLQKLVATEKSTTNSRTAINQSPLTTIDLTENNRHRCIAPKL